jgi:penicillin-binding protein 2
VLVGNTVIQELALSQRSETLHPGVVGRLAKLIGLTKAQILSELSNSSYSAYQPTPIKSNISSTTAIYVEEHQNLFPGVSVVQATQPKYTRGDLAAQVLGYVAPMTASQYKVLKKQGYLPTDQIGQSGVEASYQSYLRGKPGVEKLAVNSSGDVVSVLGVKKPTPGGNVQLTIDGALQAQAEKDLAQQIHTLATTKNSFKINPAALSGAVVIENPQDGSVYAMASYPTYNPSEWVGGMSNANYAYLNNPASGYPLLNRAIQGQYTPGSTFKLATASAALSTGLISPYTQIHDPGYFRIPNCTGNFCQLHNSGFEALGNINIVTALADSDDVFFYTLGYDFYVNQKTYGPTPIQNFAAKYGWGHKTGINLPGELPGNVDSLQQRQLLHKLDPTAYPYANWFTADQLEMAFGQGETLITPLQMANAYATFANGGTRYVPRIAEGIVNDSGKLIKSFPPKVAGHVVLSPSVRAAMTTGFEGAVRYGTAGGIFPNFPLSTFPLAGKTGTASVAGQAPNAWFVAFGPVGNAKYVIAAVVAGGGFGDTGAAPIVRNLFTYLLSHPVKPPTYGVGHLSAGSTQPISSGAQGSMISSTTTSTSTTGAKGAGSATTAAKGTTSSTTTSSSTSAKAG